MLSGRIEISCLRASSSICNSIDVIIGISARVGIRVDMADAHIDGIFDYVIVIDG